jgi:dihydroflavonol-4-reductase
VAEKPAVADCNGRGIAGLTGREPMATVDGLRMSTHPMYFSSAEAARDLGCQSRPYTPVSRDAMALLQQTGRLK